MNKIYKSNINNDNKNKYVTNHDNKIYSGLTKFLFLKNVTALIFIRSSHEIIYNIPSFLKGRQKHDKISHEQKTCAVY
jgi:hypothetical protein